MNISGLYAINRKKVIPFKDGNWTPPEYHRVSPNRFFQSIPDAFIELKRLLGVLYGKNGTGYDLIDKSNTHITIKTHKDNIEYTYYIERVTIRID